VKRIGWSMFTAAIVVSLAAPPAHADTSPAMSLLDRVVARWYAPETGGPSRPQFVFERELAFEARLESLADPDPEEGPYHARHVRAALDQHIAETLLAALPILDAIDPKTLAARAEAARRVLEDRVHGRSKLIEAAAAEGIGSDELDALLRRKARARLYLETMIGPMLEPSELELRTLWRTGATPFKAQYFDQIKAALSIWYVEERLAHETDAYFQKARARVVIRMSRRLK
jgi:hypothetical protein